jgi:hypothetical protein
MSIRDLAVMLVLVPMCSCGSCWSTNGKAESRAWQKITFDVGGLDAEGLTGPPDGRHSVSYEFCIPDTAECKAEVKSIDPTVEFMPGCSGRIGCTEGECLCIGSTHQESWRQVLRRLAKLKYIKRIDECLFE